jgi:hypothetical protein
MIIDELLKLLKSNGVGRDETGDVVIDPIGDAYDRAYNRALEKYDKPKPVVITDSSNLDACF